MPLRRLPVFAVLVVSVVGYLIVRTAAHPDMLDFAIYRAEGSAVWHGADIYQRLRIPGGFQATYPPFAAMVFVPASFLPWQVGQIAVNIANLGLVGLVSWQSCRLVGVGRGSTVVAATALTSLAIWLEPVYSTLALGQINLVLLALVLWDFTSPAESRRRGIGTGLAAGLKVTPIVFIVYLLLTGRVRSAATAAGTFAATLVVSAIVMPTETWHYWTRYLFQTGRVGDMAKSTNQSLQGVFARVTGMVPPAFSLSLLATVMALTGLGCAVYVYHRVGEAWGLTACAAAGLLGSPITWTHHWVWCIPITALLFRAAPRWAVLVPTFWIFAAFHFQHSASSALVFPPWKVAISASYALLGVGLIVIATTKARAAAGHAVPDGTPAAIEV